MTAPNWPALRGARLRRVIEVEFNHGAGTPDDPVRRVFAYYDAERSDILLAITDPTIDVSMMAKGWRPLDTATRDALSARRAARFTEENE